MPHRYPKKAQFPEGATQVEQFCEICGERRIAYRSGSKAYFSKDSGSRMPFPTACITNKHMIENAKVVSIATFVKASQVDNCIASIGKFIEAVFIIKYIQEKGIDEHSSDMLNGFLDSLDEKALVETKAV